MCAICHNILQHIIAFVDTEKRTFIARQLLLQLIFNCMIV